MAKFTPNPDFLIAGMKLESIKTCLLSAAMNLGQAQAKINVILARAEYRDTLDSDEQIDMHQMYVKIKTLIEEIGQMPVPVRDNEELNNNEDDTRL
jgi:hypothetical protein